jgi:hypothetical protein
MIARKPPRPLLYASRRLGPRDDWTEFDIPCGETWKSVGIAGLSINPRELGG